MTADKKSGFVFCYKAAASVLMQDDEEDCLLPLVKEHIIQRTNAKKKSRSN